MTRPARPRHTGVPVWPGTPPDHPPGGSPGRNGVGSVRIAIERIADHNRPTSEIRDGVQWDWTDEEERERDALTRAGLRRLAG